MEPGPDFEQIMRWSERLRVYAEVQGMYYAQLRDQGFDTEQSYLFVRDWSAHTLGWTAAPVRPPIEALDPFGIEPGVPYLIALPDPPVEDDAGSDDAEAISGAADTLALDDDYLDEAA